MAVIGKIREKSTLMLIVVGGALLAFVMTDYLGSGGNFSSGPQSIAEIDGFEISPVVFENEVNAQIADYQLQQNVAEIPDGVESQIREQVWNTMLRDQLMGGEYNSLGVTVTTREMKELTIGGNPHPQIREAFTNPETGQFNSADVINFLKNLDRDETGKTRAQWMSFQKAIEDQRQITKYNTLISKGLYATTTEAKTHFEDANKKVSIQYIMKYYNNLPDSAESVSEGDIEAYYDAHPQEFKQEKIRSLRFVSFNIVPSAKDSLFTAEAIDDIAEKFAQTENDSLFVSANSDNEFDNRLYSRNLLPANQDTLLLERDSVGYMQGPELLPDGTYRITKISKIKYAPDSVKARHIVISFQKLSKEEALAKADSIKGALEGGADFAEMASQFSEDPTNKDNGGDLGWFEEGVMLPAINDACFSAELGEYVLIESRVGAHIFEVLEKSPVNKKIQLAVIERKIQPSRDTYSDYFSMANEFLIEMEGGKNMLDLASEKQYFITNANVRESDNALQGMVGSREIIRWAYAAQEGAVSEAFDVDGKYIVAELTDIKEEGVAPLEKVRDQALAGAIKDKKAERLMNEMRGNSLEEIAETIGEVVKDISGIAFSAFSVPQIGFEPELTGKIFSLEQGDLSLPIKGRNGVFVVHLQSIEEAPEAADYRPSKSQLQQSWNARANFEVFEALKDRANVTDNRYLFY